jgi:uncharacterized protein
LGSRRLKSFQNIPASGKQALMQWINEQDIRVKVVHFVDAANKTTSLNPGEFQPVESFHPPLTGPSFDCRTAHSPIETTICGNVRLAALDLEMADLYRRMHLSYDTVGDREQLRDLQRLWLAHRNGACPDGPNQIQCLEAEYQRQHDVLENWVPIRKIPKN